jgi:hypothetical protein
MGELTREQKKRAQIAWGNARGTGEGVEAVYAAGMADARAALAQPQGEPEQSLVERALDAWYTDGESKPYDDLQRSCMADAGRVFMEAALAEPEMREINAAFWKDDDNYASAAKRLFANRHLQILGQLESLPATEDAPVERVTIHSRSGGEYHEVKLDGKLQCTFGGFDLKTAERYAAGLRKELADAK